jgi:hypothetical protein
MHLRHKRRRIRELIAICGVAVAAGALPACTAAIAVPPPAARVQVPPGHMPPPGSCRIWFPDRPPGQQPPPGSCSTLRHHVPPGAYLVRG